jgi:hypothetical protein
LQPSTFPSLRDTARLLVAGFVCLDSESPFENQLGYIRPEDGGLEQSGSDLLLAERATTVVGRSANVTPRNGQQMRLSRRAVRMAHLRSAPAAPCAWGGGTAGALTHAKASGVHRDCPPAIKPFNQEKEAIKL